MILALKNNKKNEENMANLSIGVLERRRNTKVEQLKELGPVLQGSIATIKSTCGKANCKIGRAHV